MRDWKEQLKEVKNKSVTGGLNTASPSFPREKLIAELLDRADLLKKDYAKIRRKLLREEKKEPYTQSVSLIKSLVSEQRRIYKQLAEVGAQLNKLNPASPRNVRSFVARSYDNQRTRWLAENVINKVSEQQNNENFDKSSVLSKINSASGVTVRNKTVLKKSLNKDTVEQKEAEMLVRAYGIVQCSECVEGRNKLVCPACNGTGRMGETTVTKEVKVRCSDMSFDCKLCGGMGEYYTEVLTYHRPICGCRTGFIGTKLCDVCSGIGVIATRSPKGKMATSTFMSRLMRDSYAERLQAIKHYLMAK